MKLKQSEFAALVLKMTADKETIQSAIDRGAKIKELAVRYAVPVSSFRSVFGIVGLSKRAPAERPVKCRVVDVDPAALRSYMDGTHAIALVVARIARQVKMDCSEVTEFLNGH